MYKKAPFLLFSIIFLCIGNVYAQPVIKWAFDPWAPMHEKSVTGTPKGLFVEIIHEILTEEMGYTVEHHQLPWKRAQALVKSGELDFMITNKTDERSKYALFSENPMYVLQTTIYTHKEHPRLNEIMQIKSIDDIKSLNLKVIGALGNGWMKKNIESQGIQTHYTEDLDNALKMIARKRGDITLELQPTTNLYIQKLELQDKIHNTGIAVGEWRMHFALSKKFKNPEVVNLFSKSLEKLQKNGRLQEIAAPYLNSN